MIDLGGKAALVTGGSRGIGRACCELLAKAGARIVVNYQLERPGAEAVVARIQEGGGEAVAVGADVSKREEAEMLVDEAIERFGGLDIVVNNAGIWKGVPVEEISDGEWNEMLAVNLTGTFNVVRAAVPHMKRTGGRIINISSTAGQRGEAGHSHYAASKGGVIALTKSLAGELGPNFITANCVAPGWVETDMTYHVLQSERRNRIMSEIPLGRVGRPVDVAGAVLFLASDLAAFVNGAVLEVNGGSVLRG